MLNFTQLKFRWIQTGLFLFLGAVGLFAQGSHTMSISAPSSIAGGYRVWVANFGPGYCDANSTVSGPLAFIRDGAGGTFACDTVTNDLTGRIAVIDRGTCSFSVKAYNAQKKGARAVVILNNQATGIFPMAAGVNASLVTIPVFILSKENADNIRAEIAAGTVTASFTPFASPSKAEAGVVWGDDPGEGDFRCGPNGWTFRTLSCGNSATPSVNWRWSPNGGVTGGCNAFSSFDSPSNFDGAMVFESDLYDNNGAGCGGAAVGTGPCPAPQVAELISPTIDLSGSSAPSYSLEFHQSTIQFRSNYFIGWSTDGGTTWDSVQINTDIPVNEGNEENLIRVPLLGTGGASTLIVKFRYEANYYFWAIDDVRLVEQEAFNLQVNPFYAYPQNAVTPLDFVEPINFLADVENVGASRQLGVNLDAVVLDNGFAEAFKSTLVYDTMEANTIYENRLFPQTYTPTEKGIYIGYYEIYSTQADVDSNNNVQAYIFQVQDSTFAKDQGPTRTIAPASSSWEAGQPHSWAFGNYFYVPSAKGKYIRSVQFMIGNANEIPNQAAVVNIYKWVDANDDGIAQPAERTSKGSLFYIIGGGEAPDSLITMPLTEANGSAPIALEDDSHYLVMLEYYASGSESFEITAGTDVDYGGMITASIIRDKPRYGAFLGVNSDLAAEDYTFFGFSGALYSIVPIVRMNVGDLTTTSTQDIRALNNRFTVFPNPATTELNIQFSLDTPVKTAQVTLFDLTGRVVLQRNFDSIRNQDMVRFNLPQLPAGAYLVQVATEEGIGTKRLLVK